MLLLLLLRLLLLRFRGHRGRLLVVRLSELGVRCFGRRVGVGGLVFGEMPPARFVVPTSVVRMLVLDALMSVLGAVLRSSKAMAVMRLSVLNLMMSFAVVRPFEVVSVAVSMAGVVLSVQLGVATRASSMTVLVMLFLMVPVGAIVFAMSMRMTMSAMSVSSVAMLVMSMTSMGVMMVVVVVFLMMSVMPVGMSIVPVMSAAMVLGMARFVVVNMVMMMLFLRKGRRMATGVERFPLQALLPSDLPEQGVELLPPRSGQAEALLLVLGQATGVLDLHAMLDEPGVVLQHEVPWRPELAVVGRELGEEFGIEGVELLNDRTPKRVRLGQRATVGKQPLKELDGRVPARGAEPERVLEEKGMKASEVERGWEAVGEAIAEKAESGEDRSAVEAEEESDRVVGKMEMLFV